ncbi:MAG: DUF4342 domain-containing protein [Eubacteriales bacterium]|nr:DUF4342 domain-containing protein [Eubacteriales bacterium]
MATQDKGNNIFSFLYRTRVKVTKQETPIMNLSIIFTALVVFSAPWVAVIGLIIALIMGYRFSIERDAAGFSGDFQEVVKDAASNVKATVDSVVSGSKNDSDHDAEE